MRPPAAVLACSPAIASADTASGVPTFYTTVEAESVRDYMPAAPVLVTATSYWRYGQRSAKWRRSGAIPAPCLPDQVPEIAADSGGFVAAYRHGGRYPFGFEAYVDWLYSIGPRLSWAALPDMPVERELAATRADVRARQQLTLDNARALWGADDTELERVPWSWVATIQGRDVRDYVWMAEQLGPLLVEQLSAYAFNAYALDRYDGVDADVFDWAEHGARYARIGIGSLCRRSSVAEIVEIVRAVADVLPGQRFHLWGVKLGTLGALRAAGLLDRVASIDSAAWSARFGRDLNRQRSSGLSERAYAWRVAWPTYVAKLEAAIGGGVSVGQLELFGGLA